MGPEMLARETNTTTYTGAAALGRVPPMEAEVGRAIRILALTSEFGDSFCPLETLTMARMVFSAQIVASTAALVAAVPDMVETAASAQQFLDITSEEMP